MLMPEMMAAGHVPAKGGIDGRANFAERAAVGAQSATERTATPATCSNRAGTDPGQADLAYGRQGALERLLGYVPARDRRQSCRGADRHAHIPGAQGRAAIC